MLWAKEPFRCLKINIRSRKLTSCKKLLDVAFSMKSDKVKLYSTDKMTDLCKPPNNHGMKILDRNAFKKTVMVPCLVIKSASSRDVLTLIKKFTLKLLLLKGVQEMEDNKRRILIDPKLINSWEDFDEDIKRKLEKLNINENNFSKVSLDLGYENWRPEDLLKSVLPKETLQLRSYSLIGHIIHLNIKEELLDYKYVIAEILLDKVSLAKTVICKKNFISNVYRNFEMEVLCGEPNFITSVSENNCQFELDFSKVYWNPRLSTEHSRIVKIVEHGDVLFDIFAGIGPFSIPAAKKGCTVFANDLNPESVKWLEHNITLNKKAKDYITCFNKNGVDFILEDVKQNLLKFWNDDCFCGTVHIVMNLPAIAPTFMKYFKGLFSKSKLVTVDVEKIKKCLPIVHCYFFTHGEECEKTVFEKDSEMKLDDIEHSLHFIRKVSSSGSMVRITFSLPFDYLTEGNESTKSDEPLPKRICTK